MSLLFSYLVDPAHWSGPTGIPVRIAEHLFYSVLALALGAVVAVPLGALIGHTHRGEFLVVGIANGMRALPELGLLTLLVLLMGIDLVPVTLALAVLAVPPLLAGTYSGVRNVDAGTVDAARGVGMREWQVLTKVEFPNALPLVLGGLRAASLQVIATAAVAAFVSFGGLGRLLIDGLKSLDYSQMAAGAILVAALALAVEALLAMIQRVVVSPGLRGGARRSPLAEITGADTALEPPAPEPVPAAPRPTTEPAGAEP